MFIHTTHRKMVDFDVDSALGHSLDLAETIEGITDVPVTVWASPYSPTGNSIVWSSRFDSIRELDNAQSGLFSANDYLEGLRRLSVSFSNPHFETLVEVFVGTPPSEPAPFLTTMRATARQGHQRQAIDWGLRLRDEFARGMGIPVTFALNVFGEVGGLVWLAYHRDADSLQTANSKMLADENIPFLLEEGDLLVRPDMTLLMLRRLN
jgi:hypothetical protein